MGSKKQYQIFNKSLAGVITILIIGSGILIRGTKDKSNFKKITGVIKSLDKKYQELPNRDQAKYRYLSVDNYQKTFEIFIGKDPGDFKPEYENIDALQLGDEITVFYDEINTETDSRINRLLQYIDKQDQPFYIRGRHDEAFGYFFIITGVIIGIWIFYLKQKGTII